MKRFWGWLLLLLLAACQAEPAPPPAITPSSLPIPLRIGIDSSAIALADMVAASSSNPVSPQFVTANNDALLADLTAGQLPAILVHYIPAGSPGWFNPVALDGLVFVVHPDNPVQNLSLGEAQAVFNGRITNWSALGGPDLAIHLVSREQGAGTRAILQQRVLAEQRISINALIQPDDPALLVAVADDPAAIGFSMMGTAVTANVNVLTIDGIAPTPTTTADQSYPLTVPLYFLSPTEPQGDLRAFLAWLQSDDGQGMIGGGYGRAR
ncbi:MAG: substrate-binding domain-containing protein [Ardenticatenaceae bacterium]|nr:substrate-binding domain-containing protein [Ardenticatenaceae bacterium]MCB9443594.1 substrate-binding domain-containing protein [Ardenticatenaceae bacterium]